MAIVPLKTLNLADLTLEIITSKHGKMGVIVKVGGTHHHNVFGVGVFLYNGRGVFHYYRRDLEVIHESR